MVEKIKKIEKISICLIKNIFIRTKKIKLTAIMLILVGSFSINLFSQVEIIPTLEVNYKEFDYQKYKQIFSDIDANSISTSFLSDKAIQLIPFIDYSGSDSTKTITLYKWQQLYNQVETSLVGHKYRFPSLDSIYYEYSKKSNTIKQYDNEDDMNNVKENINHEEFIPISVIDINYNTIRRDAFEKNLLTVSNKKIIETTNRRESPYTIENLFVATTLKTDIYQGNNVNFLFDEDFYFTNKNEDNLQYSIDFDDGIGLRDIDFGQTLNVNYSSTGEKTIKLIKTQSKHKSTTTSGQSINYDFFYFGNGINNSKPNIYNTSKHSHSIKLSLWWC